MNKEYTDYLLSSEWSNIKIDLFEKRGRKCEKCGCKNKLVVHHLTYENIFNEEPKDLIILCENCHLKEHRLIKVKGKKPKKQLTLAQKVLLKKQKIKRNKYNYFK